MLGQDLLSTFVCGGDTGHKVGNVLSEGQLLLVDPLFGTTPAQAAVQVRAAMGQF